MKEKKAYLARLDLNKIKQIKSNKEFTVKFRINKWISVLCNKDEFDLFFEKEVKAILESKEGFNKLNSSNLTKYTLTFDKDNLDRFAILCRENKMSVNYAINLLLNRYCDEGDLFTVTIKI